MSYYLDGLEMEVNLKGTVVVRCLYHFVRVLRIQGL